MRVFKEIPIVDESCTDPCNLGSDGLWHETMTGHIEALFPYHSCAETTLTKLPCRRGR